MDKQTDTMLIWVMIYLCFIGAGAVTLGAVWAPFPINILFVMLLPVLAAVAYVWAKELPSKEGDRPPHSRR